MVISSFLNVVGFTVMVTPLLSVRSTVLIFSFLASAVIFPEAMSFPERFWATAFSS